MGNSKVAFWETELSEILARIGLTKSQFQKTLNEWTAAGSTDSANFNWIAEMERYTSTPMFFGARDWDDICALYELYFRGYLPTVPTQGSPLSVETSLLSDQLLSLLRHGALTIKTQTGNCDRDERQRAYLEAYVNTSVTDLGKLFQALTNRNALVTIVHPGHSAKSASMSNLDTELATWNGVPEKYATDMFMQSARYTTAAPTNNEYILGQKGKRIPLLVNSDEYSRKWWTSQSIPYPTSANEHKAENDRVFSAWKAIQDASLVEDSINVVFLRVIHTDFCKADLIATVKAALKASKIEAAQEKSSNFFGPLLKRRGGQIRSRRRRSRSRQRTRKARSRSRSRRSRSSQRKYNLRR